MDKKKISNIGYVIFVPIICCKAGGQYEVFCHAIRSTIEIVYVLKLTIVDTKEKKQHELNIAFCKPGAVVEGGNRFRRQLLFG